MLCQYGITGFFCTAEKDASIERGLPQKGSPLSTLNSGPQDRDQGKILSLSIAELFDRSHHKAVSGAAQIHVLL